MVKITQTTEFIVEWQSTIYQIHWSVSFSRDNDRHYSHGTTSPNCPWGTHLLSRIGTIAVRSHRPVRLDGPGISVGWIDTHIAPGTIATLSIGARPVGVEHAASVDWRLSTIDHDQCHGRDRTGATRGGETSDWHVPLTQPYESIEIGWGWRNAQYYGTSS